MKRTPLFAGCFCLMAFSAMALAQSVIITYDYDTLGRLTGTGDDSGSTVNYEYDDAGNRKKVTVAQGNSDPVAVNDSITLNGLYSPKSINVLSNDSDPDGDPLTITTIQSSSTLDVKNKGGGILEVVAVGFKQTYQSFTYTVSDGKGSSDTATVSVTTR